MHLLQRRLRTKIHASRVGSVLFSMRHNTKLNRCTNMGVWGRWQHHTGISQFWSTSYDKNISIEHVLELLKRVTPYSHIHRTSSHPVSYTHLTLPTKASVILMCQFDGNQAQRRRIVDCKQDTKNSKTKPDTIGMCTSYKEGYGLRYTLLEWVASPSLCVIIRNSIGAPTWVCGVNGSTTR